MKSGWVVIGALLLTLTPLFGQSPANRVHPFVGTDGEGQTFPSVGVPFGMTGWTPATRDTEAKGVAPYYHADPRILGFRGSHFLSGSATQDYGSFQLLAGRGTLHLTKRPPSSSFVAEHATPYRYDVELPDLGVQASVTGSGRSGLLRFVIQDGGSAWLLVRNNARPSDGITTLDPAQSEINGSNAVRRLYAGQGKLAGFSGYVVVQFDHPFRVGGTWAGNRMLPDALRSRRRLEVRACTSPSTTSSPARQCRRGSEHPLRASTRRAATSI